MYVLNESHRCGSTPQELCECDECQLFRDTAHDVTLNRSKPEPMPEYNWELAFNAIAQPDEQHAPQFVGEPGRHEPERMEPMREFDWNAEWSR